MEAYFAVHFILRKGMGPEHVPHLVNVGLDDIDPGTTEEEIREMVLLDAESQLRKTEDYPVYGKNWIYKDMERI